MPDRGLLTYTSDKIVNDREGQINPTLSNSHKSRFKPLGALSTAFIETLPNSGIGECPNSFIHSFTHSLFH